MVDMNDTTMSPKPRTQLETREDSQSHMEEHGSGEERGAKGWLAENAASHTEAIFHYNPFDQATAAKNKGERRESHG